MTVSNYAQFLWELCCWREARGEALPTKIAQAWSVWNRASKPSWWGNSIVSVILKPWQYSSFNKGDPNATRFPAEADEAWSECAQAVQKVIDGIDPDPTEGATHYFDKSLDSKPPNWATDGSMVKTADIGSFHFYRIA